MQEDQHFSDESAEIIDRPGAYEEVISPLVKKEQKALTMRRIAKIAAAKRKLAVAASREVGLNREDKNYWLGVTDAMKYIEAVIEKHYEPEKTLFGRKINVDVVYERKDGSPYRFPAYVARDMYSGEEIERSQYRRSMVKRLESRGAEVFISVNSARKLFNAKLKRAIDNTQTPLV